MPQIAALYDIHGNLPALEAVMTELRRNAVDGILVGGDVMPGPMPRECLDLLRSCGIPTTFIRGNGESAALEALEGGPLDNVPEAFRPAVRWSAEQMPDEYVEWISRWPMTAPMAVDGLGDVLFCHATPRSDTQIVTRLSPETRIQEMFEGVGQLVVCGHTHMQFDRTVDALRVVNAGSVGMPFADPGAYWLLLGPDIQRRRTAYDITDGSRRIRATSYPAAPTFAAQVLSPKSEEEMLAVYARVDGRSGPGGN